MLQRLLPALAACASLLCHTAPAAADNWPQFRGPAALGRSEASGLPLTWSDTQNVAWKTPLPGPGSSSPIVQAGRIYLTCFTGYGVSEREPGDMASLQRHLLCVDAADGHIVWDAPVPAELPEQERIREDHGYATSTPVTDGERVYAFFGKSGVFAFDLAGKPLWRTSVGSKLNGWGSAASPILHGDLLLVNASIESESLVALDRRTGREVWRQGGLTDSWHAPVILRAPDGKSEIVMAMLRQVLAFDPDGGKPLWHCDTAIHWYMCPTPVALDGVVYVIGGRTPSASLAIRAGGRGDVTATHRLWRQGKGSNVPSPILHEGHLYFVHENLGVADCLDAKTGAVVYEERLNPSPGQVYASPVMANGRIYITGRNGRTVVIAARPKFEMLGESTLEGGRGMFNAGPAIAGGRLYLRSNRYLYAFGGR